MSKPLASIGKRFTSQFIDDLVALAVGVVFYLAAKALELPLELAVVGFMLYVLLCDGLPGGQSLGKRMTRTAVVHAVTEEPCRYWQSLVRIETMADSRNPKSILEFYTWKAANYAERIEHS